MKSLKKLPLVLTAVGLGAVSSFAEIKLTDNLSVTGFLDMSVNGAADTVTETLNGSVDQFEVDFMFKFSDKISARADVNALPSSKTQYITKHSDTLEIPNTGLALEQGFVTYSNSGLSLSAGRFLSSSGFEAAEPTGMFQYSYSKALYYGAYQNGVSAAYSTPLFGIYGAIVSDLWIANEFDLLNSPGFEGQVSLTPVEGVTAKVTYLYQMYDEDATGDASKQLLNSWASYAKGPVTLAAEYSLLLDWDVPDGEGRVNDGTGHGFLAMTNYKFNDFYAATLRFSGNLLGDADLDSEVTFSPSVLLSPNWLALAEIRQDFRDEKTSYAVESTFSF